MSAAGLVRAVVADGRLTAHVRAGGRRCGRGAARALDGMLRTLRERADLRVVLHCVGIAWGLMAVVDALHSRAFYW